MALPPTIPTSFVPKQPVATVKKRSAANPFLMLSYGVLGLAVLAAAGVFGYKLFLEGVAKRKAAAVTAAEQQVDQATVSEFIRLRDRFTAAKDILNNHVAVSNFLNALEAETLEGVRFTKLQLSVDDTRTASITMTGTARTFNTLAAQSAAFNNDRRIKRAIFSGIGNDKNLVQFELKADLEPSLVVFNDSAALAPQEQGTSTEPQP